MKRLSLYITPTHASVTIQNGVSRETSAPTISQMLDGMPDRDREALTAFCKAICDYMDPQDANEVNALVKP